MARGLKVKVGQLTSPTVTGSVGYAGVGFQPKALIIYTTWAASTGYRVHQNAMIGFVSGAADQYAVSTASLNGATPSDTSRRMAAKAVTMVEVDGATLLMEANLTSFDIDGFTLNWTTVGLGTARIINYIALGGDDLINAKVMLWNEPTAAGDKTVTGIGFKPDCVLHASHGNSTLSSGSTAAFRFGAMDKEGNQWVNSFISMDAVNPSNTSRAQWTDRCLGYVYANEGIWNKAVFKSMNNDGFTVTYQGDGTSIDLTAANVISLCLRGGSYRVGNYICKSSAGYQAIGGVGFEPTGLLQTTTWSALGAASTIQWSLGAASSALDRKAIAFAEQDAVATSNVDAWQGDKAIGQAWYDSVLYANAELASFDSNGFTLNWAIGEGVVPPILYLAFGNAVVEDIVLDAGVNVRVGTLSHTPPGLISVTGIGFRPKAIIFYGVDTTANGFTPYNDMFVGFAAGGGKQFSVAAGNTGQATPTNTFRGMAASAILRLYDNGSVYTYSEGKLESFDSDGFTINWVNSNEGYWLNYIALGGKDITDATVVGWGRNGATGNQAVTGIGFRPDLAMHLLSCQGSLGTSSQAYFAWGAMDKDGNQWSNSFAANDNVATTDTARGQRTDRCMYAVEVNGTGVVQQASYVSMDTDGFTLNWSEASTYQLASLCLKGPRFKVGSFQSATAVGTQSVSGTGFRPKGLLLSAYGNNAATAPAAHTVWSLGAASSPADEKGIGIRDQDAVASASSQGYHNDKIISGLSPVTASVLDFQGDLSSFDTDGFSISWTTMDTFTEQILYLGIGDASRGFLQQGGWGFPA